MFDPDMCRAFVQMMRDFWTDGMTKGHEIFLEGVYGYGGEQITMEISHLMEYRQTDYLIFICMGP